MVLHHIGNVKMVYNHIKSGVIQQIVIKTKIIDKVRKGTNEL